MKNLTIICLLLAVVLSSNSCSLFKHRTAKSSIEKSTVTNNVAVKKATVEGATKEVKGVSERSNVITSEEITVRRTDPNPSIELTAKFRVDTSGSLKGDTALKLVDVNNADVSVTVYQNKKTNELMAKVTTKGRSQSVPFTELQIKKNYSSSNEKIDTTKKESLNKSLQLDSVDKTKTSSKKKNKTTESKPTATLLWSILGGIAIIVTGIIIYLKIKK